MKYYIEVWGRIPDKNKNGLPAGGFKRKNEKPELKLLPEYSRACEDRNYNWILFLVALKVKNFASKIKIYSHDGLINAETIKPFYEYLFPAGG